MTTKDEDGLYPVEQKIAKALWDRWPHAVHPSIDVSAVDPRTVARHLRPLLAEVWDEGTAVQHRLDDDTPVIDNPYREDT